MNLLTAWEGTPAADWAGRLGLATAEFHASVTSTNDRARSLVTEGASLPLVVVADRQTAGRGRRGRRWHSDTALGLWCTYAAAKPSVSTAQPDEDGAAVLPLRLGLAVARAVESAAPGSLLVQVKWPNDLLLEGAKVGGILCERAGAVVLAGIGLNLNHAATDLPSSLEYPVASLRQHTGRLVPRDRVLTAVCEAVTALWKSSASTLLPRERAELDRRSPILGRRVRVSGVVRTPSGSTRSVRSAEAVAAGVGGEGSLRLRGPKETEMRLVAGSVAVQP